MSPTQPLLDLSLGALTLGDFAWPIAFAAFGAAMFSMCTYRRNCVRGKAIEALEQAQATMVAIENGVDADRHPKQGDGPFEDQLHTIRSIGRRLAARTRHLSAIIEAEPECVKIVNAAGLLVQMNPAGLRMIAADNMEQVQGLLVEDLLLEEHRSAFREMHASVLEGNSASLTFQIEGLDGQRHWMETCAVPLADSEGEIVQLAVTREVTERKRQEDETSEARERAEAANKAKSDFLANMSHELRTPLTAILGYSDLLGGEEDISEDHSIALRAINGSAEHLLALISDVLDVSKIEAGHLEVESVTFDLAGVIKRTVQALHQQAVEAGITLDVEWAPDVPHAIQSDPVRIRQILNNLLSNALKFTLDGGIKVRVSAGARSAPEGRFLLQIAVTDTGLGMEALAIERLFEPFQQADSSTTRRFGGTGLGLGISRHLARVMGGELTAESQIGSGSTFTLEVPVTPAIDSEVKPLRDVDHSRFEGRVLIVEDNPVNRRVLRKLLERRGLDVETAVDGSEGLQRAQQSVGTSKPFQLVFMDMHMPVLDGYTTTRMLKDTEFQAPIVALTASAMADDRRRCLDAGCDDYLPKPVDKSALTQLLSRYLDPGSPSRSGGEAPG